MYEIILRMNLKLIVIV